MKSIFKNKKVIIIAASAIVVIAAIVLTIVTLNGGFGFRTSPTIEVESVEGKVGDTIKVPVRVYKNPGVMGYFLNFEYDDSVLTYVEYEKGDFLTNYEFSTYNGVLSFVNVENKDVDENGVLFYLKFRIKETDKNETEIKLNLTGEEAANSQEKWVKFEGENGTVTIK